MNAPRRNIAPARRGRAFTPERRGFLQRALAVLTGGAVLAATPRRALAASQPFIGELMLTAAWFVPDGWLPCDGRLLPIGSYSELFSIIGTTYGGDGVETFALPDLRGRAPMHFGGGPGLTPRELGEAGGQEAEGLTASHMPVHDHAAVAGTANGTSPIPTGLYPAQNPAGNLMYGSGPDASFGTTTPNGANQLHTNLQPFLAMHYCIAPFGIYPSRS